jgi:predicted dehydrogenase
VSWGDPNRGPEAAESRIYGLEATEPYNIKEFTMDFVRRIAEGRKPAVGYEEALKALELALAARQAAAAEDHRSRPAKDWNP